MKTNPKIFLMSFMNTLKITFQEPETNFQHVHFMLIKFSRLHKILYLHALLIPIHTPTNVLAGHMRSS